MATREASQKAAERREEEELSQEALFKRSVWFDREALPVLEGINSEVSEARRLSAQGMEIEAGRVDSVVGGILSVLDEAEPLLYAYVERGRCMKRAKHLVQASETSF